MIWKTLIILTFVAVGVLAGTFELKGSKRDRLQQTVERNCKKDFPEQFDHQMDRIFVQGLVMGAAGCVYENIGRSLISSKSSNASATEEVLKTVSTFCRIRPQLRKCAQDLIDYLAPCTTPSVQTQVGEMKVAITDIFKLFCDNDMQETHRFIDDGGVDCLVKSNAQISNCSFNIMKLATELPEDTNSFEAIELCYKYDEMTSCVLTKLTDCRKASTKEFVENVFTLFRAGTFCRATVPIEPTGNDI